MNIKKGIFEKFARTQPRGAYFIDKTTPNTLILPKIKKLIINVLKLFFIT